MQRVYACHHDGMGMAQFASAVAAELPRMLPLVPADPAARLGRWAPNGHATRGTKVQSALSGISDAVSERLLGALELSLDQFTVDIPAELLAGLSQPTHSHVAIMRVAGREPAATKQSVDMLESIHPGVSDLVLELVTELQYLANVADATGTEAEIASQHGAAHLALAVLVSTAVLRAVEDANSVLRSWDRAVASETGAIIGVALGVAAIVLPTAPKPRAYAEAVLDKRRAEYLFPLSTAINPVVTEHQFWLTEHSRPTAVDFSVNGLVTAVSDGVAIRTGMAQGKLHVPMTVLAEPPEDVELSEWDDVVEISWTAPEGGATPSGSQSAQGYSDPLGTRHRCETPPWPGNYRIRAHARERDDAEDAFRLILWPAAAEPEIVHKKTDRLGHRLRGESEPPVVAPPDAAHRWIRKSWLSEAATITVVRGLTTDEVVTALGADPAEPISLSDFYTSPNYGEPSLESPLAVLAVDDIVLAIEENGFQGANPDTVIALSQQGSAASVFWNINGVFRLTFAENGELHYTGEPLLDASVPHGEDLHFENHRYPESKGLTAIARFIGRDITAEDLAAIEAADRCFAVH